MIEDAPMLKLVGESRTDLSLSAIQHKVNNEMKDIGNNLVSDVFC